MPSNLCQACPLNSQDPVVKENFQVLIDNFKTEGHPNVEKVILGQLDNPLRYCDAFLEVMRIKAAPATFTFDPRKTRQYLDLISMTKPELIPTLDKMLDGKQRTGYRPVNAAIYSTLTATLMPTDLYMLQQVERKDGIGLRNLIWRKLDGGTTKQRRIASMKTKMDLSDQRYMFQPDGIEKYFSGIHRKLGRFKLLGRTMDRMELFTTIFQHMENQCMEYRDVINKERDTFIEDENSVTLQSLQLSLSHAESASVWTRNHLKRHAYPESNANARTTYAITWPANTSSGGIFSWIKDSRLWQANAATQA